MPKISTPSTMRHCPSHSYTHFRVTSISCSISFIRLHSTFPPPHLRRSVQVPHTVGLLAEHDQRESSGGAGRHGQPPVGEDELPPVDVASDHDDGGCDGDADADDDGPAGGEQLDAEHGAAEEEAAGDEGEEDGKGLDLAQQGRVADGGLEVWVGEHGQEVIGLAVAGRDVVLVGVVGVAGVVDGRGVGVGDLLGGGGHDCRRDVQVQSGLAVCVQR